MKPILSSLKEKRRYLVYEVLTDRSIKFSDVVKTFNRKFYEFFGEKGVSNANIKILDDFSNNKGIIMVDNKSLDEIRASLCLIDKIDDKDVIIKSVGVSGILKKARSKFYGG